MKDDQLQSPWTCREYGSPRGRYFIKDSAGNTVASSLVCGLTKARVAAAAPELLEALKALLAANDHAVTMMMECDTQEAALHVARAQSEAFSKLLDPAREAVAKATSPTMNTQAILRDQGRG